jgi:hypothetical protein
MPYKPGQFQPGRAKTGGRRKGSVNKIILARRQAIVEAMQTLGLAPETIEAITPLAVTRLGDGRPYESRRPRRSTSRRRSSCAIRAPEAGEQRRAHQLMCSH